MLPAGWKMQVPCNNSSLLVWWTDTWDIIIQACGQSAALSVNVSWPFLRPLCHHSRVITEQDMPKRLLNIGMRYTLQPLQRKCFLNALLKSCCGEVQQHPQTRTGIGNQLNHENREFRFDVGNHIISTGSESQRLGLSDIYVDRNCHRQATDDLCSLTEQSTTHNTLQWLVTNLGLSSKH